ncbi:cysteine sulfinate desulfinase/cysteine desulfurase-like protein [Paraburkholderia sp. WSM4175]|uniref:aminotransferase class V-fold PLP-dependent enzyme n=1 Tax=Paraburkholderia sp. WSM4175 TaxID=2991072 RepID=UPI003D213B9A
MLSILTDVWGNASSQHAVGQQAKGTLAAARATIARALGCKPAELIFASGATEKPITWPCAGCTRRLLRPLLEEAAHPA